jgi:hypothetical protein
VNCGVVVLLLDPELPEPPDEHAASRPLPRNKAPTADKEKSAEDSLLDLGSIVHPFCRQ